MEHRFENTKITYRFGAGEPIGTVQSGDTVVAVTRDARGWDAQMAPLPDDAVDNAEFEPLRSNPLVGPIVVAGAEPGDALRLHIDSIRLTRDTAWSSQRPRFGALTEEVPGRRLLVESAVPEAMFTWRVQREAGTATLELPKSGRTVTVELAPFIGSIGVAPRYGRVETAMAPGEYGGNMDAPDVAPGNTLILPVWRRGAWLALGDVHARQCDGEIVGSALEISAEVRLTVELVKGAGGEWPRIESKDELMVAASSRPLMEAFKLAHVELIEWLVHDYGFDRWEALQLLSQAGTARVGNVVDPNYTVVAKLGRRYLNPG